MKTKPPKEKTTHKTYSGGDVRTTKKTIPKPKNWSFISKGEGREGKQERKKIKMERVFLSCRDLLNRLAYGSAGFSKLVVTIPALGRDLTFRDHLQLLHYLVKFSQDSEQHVLVNMSQDNHFIEIEELPFELPILPPSEPNQGTHNQ
jgi:hypothetical protein